MIRRHTIPLYKFKNSQTFLYLLLYSMAMNYQLLWLHPFLLLSLFATLSATSVFSSSSSSDSYSIHCSSIVPESAPTVSDQNQIIISDFQTVLTNYSGGDEILGKNPSESSFDSEKYVSFRTTQNIFQTKTSGIYKIEARLLFISSNAYFSSRSSRYGSFYSTSGSSRRSNSVRFVLNGFWSQNSGKLCMVGSASRYSNEGELLNLQAVLKLNHAANQTIMTSLISGKLESLSSSPSDPTYFKPVSILAFSSTRDDYHYTMDYEGFDHGSPEEIDNIPLNQLLGLQPKRFCSRVWSAYDSMKLEYTNSCNSLQRNCTPLGQEVKFLPNVMTLYPLQCSENEHKAQYLVGFGNSTYIGYYKTFDPSRTLVAEGSWDVKKRQMSIVACRILNNTLQNPHVGDCSIKLSFKYPAFISIRNRSSVVGQIWTNKTAEASGYFKEIIFRSYNNWGMGVSSPRYEYSAVDRARNLCPAKKPVGRKGEKEIYPMGYSPDMRIDMSVERLAWAYASPVFVGNQRYEPYASDEESELEEDRRNLAGPLNISYALTITSFDSSISRISSTHSSLFSASRVEIAAEGVYDGETGNLCMLGCRDLSPGDQKSANASIDCELLLTFQFPPVNSKKRGIIKGSIESMREKNHPLYFEHLNMSATAFYTEAARNSIWRMDLEVIMVLISKTLGCISVVLQLFYVKKNSDVLPFMSLLMLLILTLGHTIPLMLNFEALFSRNWNQQRVLRQSGGWIEANEVIVRVITMVAFVLQFRLLQLAYCARKSQENQKSLWAAEKKTLSVSLPLYILGGPVALLLNFARSNPRNSEVSYSTSGDYYQQHFLWGDLRSYAGLVLDGFLIPQILLNAFLVSEEKALSHSFYIGTTLVRLLPHVYDLYRARKSAYDQFFEPSIYANHSADLYSTAWDVIIPCGGLIFAAIIYFQQRFGGRCIIPRKFREAVAYAKLPVETTES